MDVLPSSRQRLLRVEVPVSGMFGSAVTRA